MSLDAKTTSPTTGRNVKSRFDYIKEPSIVENRPGPGNYETPKLFGKTGPAITISQTTAKIQEVIRPGPGPGEYKHKDYFGSGPTSRIGTGRKPEKLSPNPGPGAYEHKVFYGKDLKGGKMGTKKIEKVLATPGPGMITNKEKIPAFTKSIDPYIYLFASVLHYCHELLLISTTNR
mmetsp:Transcript_49028/g.96148  ORF Transcript_49028/g.96148 Transcript_49028/m.96148 type:complete len:176 (+) Transcript_49028:115-642(+)